jgi:hypothetical protein
MYTSKRQDPSPAGGFDLSTYYASKEVEVWPENWQSVILFNRMGTQWRVSMTGVTGLDYNVLFRLMDVDGLAGEDWSRVFADIQVMEAQAMEMMRAGAD